MILPYEEYIKDDVVIKLVCVSLGNNTKYEGFLTLGKIYEGNYVAGRYYNIVNDRGGSKDSYDKSWDMFMTVDEYRDEKLKEIGI